jgi:uncharacterized protein (TIGR03437 family)
MRPNQLGFSARLVVLAGAIFLPVRADWRLVQISTPSPPADQERAYEAYLGAIRIAVDKTGNIYTITGNLGFTGVVRKITPDGHIMPLAGFAYGSAYIPPAEQSYPILASLSDIYAIAVDPDGNLFISGLDPVNRKTYRVGTDGMMAAYVTYAEHQAVAALAADHAGNLYILVKAPNLFPTLGSGAQVVKVLPDRSVVPVAGTGVAGSGGDGGPATAAQFSATDLTVDSRGNLYIADTGSYAIRKITTDGIISKVAQGDAPVTVDGSDNLYFFLRDGTLQRLSPDGRIESVATVPNASGLAVDPSGKIFVSVGGRLYALEDSGSTRMIAGCYCFGDGVPIQWAAILSAVGMVRDAANNLYFSDASNHTIRRMTPDGITTIFAGTGDPAFGGDGGPARLASLSSPSGLAADQAGNIYVADTGNHRIRKIGTDGVIQTVAGSGVGGGFSGDGGLAVAARIALPDGVAVDGTGNIYIADTANHRIRRVKTDGTIETIAGSDNYGTSGDGGPASQALLINPTSLVFDADDNLVFTDSSAHMVRRITPGGIMQRVSGTGTPGGAGDGGPAASAQNRVPWGLAVDMAGNILIGDTGNAAIRIVDRSGNIRTLVSGVRALGLSQDPNGNVWVAGGSISVVTQADSPIPLPPAIYGMRNIASNQPAVVAPGEIVTITGIRLGPETASDATPADGMLSTELSGVRVLFDGSPAPILRVGSNQVEAIVPFAVGSKKTVGVTVEYLGVNSNTAVVDVLPAAPGVFNAILPNSIPRHGGVIAIFATGVGQIAPPQDDGRFVADVSVPVLPVSAEIGAFPGPEVPWVPLEVTYAGSVSWLPAGSIQVNLKLPEKLPESSDSNYRIALRVGNSLATTAVHVQP